jgi:hypothetical protein
MDQFYSTEIPAVPYLVSFASECIVDDSVGIRQLHGNTLGLNRYVTDSLHLPFEGG